MSTRGVSIRGRARRATTALALACAVAVAACTPLSRNHGYVPSDAALAEVTVGVDTRETVTAAVGAPSAGGVLDNSGFYYVASTFERRGFLAPREVDRQVVAITFDGRGVVRNIERFGLEQGRVVALSRRVTDATFEDRTFLRQLMGNVGRFDAGTILGEGGGN